MDYKGFYFNNDDEKRFYEGGAHFKYKELYYILENLSLTLPQQRNGVSADTKEIKRKYLFMRENPKSRNKTKNKNIKYILDSLTYKIYDLDNQHNKSNNNKFSNNSKNLTRNQKINNYFPLNYNSKNNYKSKSNDKNSVKINNEKDLSCSSIFGNNNQKKRIFVSLKNQKKSFLKFIQNEKMKKKVPSSISYDITNKNMNKRNSKGSKNNSIDLKQIYSYKKKCMNLNSNVNYKKMLNSKFNNRIITHYNCSSSSKSELTTKSKNKHYYNKSQDISSILIKNNNNTNQNKFFKNIKPKIKSEISSSIDKFSNLNCSTITINSSINKGKHFTNFIKNLKTINDKTRNQGVYNKLVFMKMGSSFKTNLSIQENHKLNQTQIYNNRTKTPIKSNDNKNINFTPLIKQNKESHHISRKETEISDLEINKCKISHYEIINKSYQKSKSIKSNFSKKINQNLYPQIKNNKKYNL